MTSPHLTLPYLRRHCNRVQYNTLPHLTLSSRPVPHQTRPELTRQDHHSQTHITSQYNQTPCLARHYLTLPYQTLPFLTVPDVAVPYLVFVLFLHRFNDCGVGSRVSTHNKCQSVTRKQHSPRECLRNNSSSQPKLRRRNHRSAHDENFS